MKDIMYLKTSSNPYEELGDYEEALRTEHTVFIPSYKSRDTASFNNVEFFGFTDIDVWPSLRLLGNLVSFDRWDTIDVVFSSHKEWFYGLLNVFFAWWHDKKSIVKFAGNIVVSYKYKRARWKRWVTYVINNCVALPLLKRADVIISLSHDLKEQLVQAGYDKEQIEVLRLPEGYQSDTYERISSDYTPSDEGLDLAEDRENVLFVGSLTKGKGMDTFLYLLGHDDIREKYHFIFAGDDYEGYADELAAYENTTVLGEIPLETVYDYYHNVDLFLFPSHSDGFGRVNAEAFSCGCPIVARDIADLRLLADHVFETDEELVSILREQDFERKQTPEWPEEFQYDNIITAYKRFFREV